MTENGITFADVPERERYELRVDGDLVGFLDYRRRAADRALVHAEIVSRHGSSGLGGELVRRALDDARAHGLTVIPICSFVRHFISEHDEYADLVGPR